MWVVRLSGCFISSCNWYFIWLNHWRRDKMAATFPYDIFTCDFWKENVWILLKVSRKLAAGVRINNFPALAWRQPGTKPLSEPLMVNLLTCIYASPGLHKLMVLECGGSVDGKYIIIVRKQSCVVGDGLANGLSVWHDLHADLDDRVDNRFLLVNR